MQELEQLLKANQYVKTKFKLSKTQHLTIKAKVNGIEGNFILDTGASNSCIDFQHESFFKIHSEETKIKIAGAGGLGMKTKLSEYNTLTIGRWRAYQIPLVLFDLVHVNKALSIAKAKPIHGIIGADVLLEGKAVINYDDKSLYLKKQDPSKRNLSLF